MKSNFLHRLLPLFSLSLALSCPIWAQGNSHNKNTGSTNWTNPAGWDTGNIPGPADTAIVNAGTLNVSGDQSIARIRLNGGTLVGETDSSTDSLTLTGDTELNSEWSTASIQNITLLIGENGTLDLESTFIKTLSASVLRIQSGEGNGVANWTGGQLRLDSASQIQNSGIFDDSASSSISTVSGSVGTFHNQSGGTYNKTATGTTELTVVFNNDGSVAVNQGTLKLDGGGTSSATGGFNVATGATLELDSSYSIANADNLSGAGSYHFASGLLTLVGTASVDFTQTGGGLTGIHNLSGNWNVLGGLLLNGSTTIDSAGTLSIDSNLTVDNHSLVNNGSVDWKSGFISMNNASTISNAQTWTDNSTLTTADNYVLTNTPATSTFSNSGTYHKNGAGISHIRIPFHNSGVLNINAGQLDLESGGSMSSSGLVNVAAGSTIRFFNTFDVPAASALTGAGNFDSVNGSMDLQGTFSGGQFSSINSTLTGDHNFDTVAILDLTLWQNGITNIGALGSLQINGHDGSSGTTLSNRSVTNEGTINWASEDLVLNDGSSITNQGSLVDQHTGSGLDSRLYTATGDAGTFTNTATGRYEKQGTDTTTFDLPFANSGILDIQAGKVALQAGGSTASTGSIQIASGASLDLRSDYSIDNAAAVSGSGSLLHSSGTLSGGGDIAPDFSQTSGVLDGDFDFSGQFNLTGGSIASNRIIGLIGEAMSVIDISGLELDGTVIDVGPSSVLAWNHGIIQTGNNGGLKVDGTVTTDFDGSIQQTLGGIGGLNITGDFRKTSGTGNTTISVPLNLSGRLEAHSGSIVITEPGVSNGGLFDVFAGASIEINNGFTFTDTSSAQNAGSLNLNNGVFNLNDNVDLGQNASISGGTITGTQTLAGRIRVNGANFDNSGTTTIGANGSLKLAHPEANFLPRNIVNQGEFVWEDGDLTGSGGNSFTNNGEFLITTDGTFGSAADDFTLTNNGSIQKTDGSGTTTIDVPFTNNGLVTALTGNFHFTDTLTFGSGGQLGGGVKFDAPLTLPADSTLQGNGTITGSIVTGGMVTPGNSIGSLNIDGDLTMLSTTVSFFEIDLSATPSPVDFLSVSGTLNLNGILSFDLLSSILPTAVENYTVLTAGTLTGAFSNILSGSRIFNPGLNASFLVNYGSTSAFDTNSVVFSSFEFTPVPEPSTFSLLAIGLGFIMWQTRRRRA